MMRSPSAFISLILVVNSTITSEHYVQSFLSKFPFNNSELTPCPAYTEYSIHHKHHSLSTTSSEDWLPPVASQSHISLQTMLYVYFYIPTITSEPMNWFPATVSPPSWTTSSEFTAVMYSSKLAPSCPASASQNSLYHSLQVCTVMIFKCVSPNLLDHNLQVYH